MKTLLVNINKILVAINMHAKKYKFIIAGMSIVIEERICYFKD